MLVRWRSWDSDSAVSGFVVEFVSGCGFVVEVVAVARFIVPR
jgi:hypothetical protein